MAKCHKKCYHFTGKAKWWYQKRSLQSLSIEFNNALQTFSLLVKQFLTVSACFPVGPLFHELGLHVYPQRLLLKGISI